MADKKEYLLRIDPKLLEEIKKIASLELRSINGQIEYMLKDAVNKRKGNSKG